MKLNEIKEAGFYTTDLKDRKVIYEVLENTDEVWLKEEPDETLLIDEWTYVYDDNNDRKVYECMGGNLTPVKFAEPIKVIKITDTKYSTPYGNSGAFMHEEKPTYKERLKKTQELELEVRRENTKLKELLKECRRQFEEVALYSYDVADDDQEDWFKISTEQAGIANKMITKINQALGENK